MKKLSIFLLILMFMFTLTLYGCAGASDYDINLSGGYSLVRSSAHNVTINKRINDSSWESPIIPAKIVQIAWDDKYILAKQLGLKRRNPNNSDDTYEIPDESKVNYWILEVESAKVYGPLTDKEFTEKKKELYISNNVVLKDISSYKIN